MSTDLLFLFNLYLTEVDIYISVQDLYKKKYYLSRNKQMK